MEDFRGKVLTLSALKERFAVCQPYPRAMIPDWATRSDFYSISRTPDEFTIIYPHQHIPLDVSWTAV
jgi:hypothetical protein